MTEPSLSLVTACSMSMLDKMLPDLWCTGSGTATNCGEEVGDPLWGTTKGSDTSLLRGKKDVGFWRVCLKDIVIIGYKK